MRDRLLTEVSLSEKLQSPLKISAAPNGARRSQANHPNLPITTLEIVREAKRCWDAGAHEIHLHVRDSDGTHSLDPGRYREAIAAIGRTVPKIDVQITTEAAGVFDVSTQLRTLTDVVPSAVSISVREIARDLSLAPKMYGFADEAGIQVQHILYGTSDVQLLKHWLETGVVSGAMRNVLLVLGQYNPPRPAQPGALSGFVKAIEGTANRWSVCAFGAHEHSVVEQAIRLGGHVRVGFENNFLRPDGSVASGTWENISLAAKYARKCGRPLLNEAHKL